MGFFGVKILFSHFASAAELNIFLRQLKQEYRTTICILPCSSYFDSYPPVQSLSRLNQENSVLTIV